MMPEVSLTELLEGLQHYRQRAERAEAENAALRAERDRLVAELTAAHAEWHKRIGNGDIYGGDIAQMVTDELAAALRRTPE